MEYEESVKWVESLPRFSKQPSLEPMQTLLAKLGNPENNIRAVHVAGTNGKGSTVAMLSSVLSKAGYKTGRYISPYVLEYRERIMIDGKMIGRKRLASILTLIKEKTEELGHVGIDLGFFEITTAAAFLWFSEEKTDFAVIETGLGGRLDATNTIPNAILQIITMIGLDHTKILGSTIADITKEKCGIMRKECTLLTCPNQSKEAVTVMMEKAMDLDATFVMGSVSGKVMGESLEGTELLVGKTELWIPLAGRHQIDNTMTVLSAIDILREKHFDISDEAVLNGIAETRFPARFELCSKVPITILDGAHNPQAMAVLSENVKKFIPGKKILVIGMMADKDVRTSLETIVPCFDRVVCVPVKSPRSADPGDLADIVNEMCDNVSLRSDAVEALNEELLNLDENSSLVVAGSLYLASELRPQLMRYKGIEK